MRLVPIARDISHKVLLSWSSFLSGSWLSWKEGCTLQLLFSFEALYERVDTIESKHFRPEILPLSEL